MNLSLLIRAVQSKLGVAVDGLAGPATWRAIHIAVVGKPWTELAATVESGGVAVHGSDKVDERSEKNIATLIPEVQPYARALVHAAADQGIQIKVIDGSRTYAQQDALFEQGRSKPGKIVTNAIGGQSNHNFGVAFDIGIFDGDQYVPESPLYKVVGSLGKSIGLEWGGDWATIHDQPHFQFNPRGYTLTQMRARKDSGLPLV